MKRYLLCSLCAFLAITGTSTAQLPSDSSVTAAFVAEAEQMTQYLAFVFNTLGNANTSPREKEVIINQSYLKVFRDEEVQIEDDLVPGRSTITNKNVQAYLKDLDFFFQSVRFTFLVQSITPNLNEQGGGYLTVALERRLQGITVDGDSVNNSQPRFIEINIYPEDRLLKIASIYTSRLSEEEDLLNWWTDLDPVWQGLFAPEIDMGEGQTLLDLMTTDEAWQLLDSMAIDSSSIAEDERERFFTQLRQMLRKRSLDLSNHAGLTDLSPLTKLRELRELNLSHTNVQNLAPLRNLAHLRRLNLSHTPVSDLSPLRYCDALTSLDVSSTAVRSSSAMADLAQLQRLSLAHTEVSDLAPLANCIQLEELDLSHTLVFQVRSLSKLTKLAVLDLSFTQVYDLKPLSELTNLQVFNCAHTNLADLAPLSQATSLRTLRVDSTRVLSLTPLRSLPNLQKIYCDQTLVGAYEVDQFRAIRPDIMVVFASASLREWWDRLSPAWRAVLWTPGMRDTPNREQLHAISRVDSLNLSGKKQLKDLTPLRALSQLRYLDISFTQVDSLNALSDAEFLRYLDCSHSQVRSLEPLRFLRQLQHIDASYSPVQTLEPLSGSIALQTLIINGTKVSGIVPLYGLSALRRLEADDTPIGAAQVRVFLDEQPECLVLFQTSQLQRWWSTLSADWRDLLRRTVGAHDPATTEDRHRMIYLIELEIKDQPGIQTLEPLRTFLRLERLYLENTRVTSLGPLGDLLTLQELSFSQHRIEDLSPLRSLAQLQVLNFENTPVVDLNPLRALLRLESLTCAGTQVEDLEALEGLLELRRVNTSNTEVKRLKPLYTLPRLEQISCFNTRISSRRIDKFQEARPKVDIVYY